MPKTPACWWPFLRCVQEILGGIGEETRLAGMSVVKQTKVKLGTGKVGQRATRGFWTSFLPALAGRYSFLKIRSMYNTAQAEGSSGY